MDPWSKKNWSDLLTVYPGESRLMVGESIPKRIVRFRWDDGKIFRLLNPDHPKGGQPSGLLTSSQFTK